MNSSPSHLQKILGRREVLGIAFGAMIGWSWVVLSGEMIIRAGTIGSLLSLLLGAVMVLLVGLTYAELTPALSRAGGELIFTFVGIGPRASFLCGWALVLAYFSVCAFEAVALPLVAQYMFPNLQSEHLYTLQGWDISWGQILLGSGGALVIGIVNYFGLRLASFLQWLASLLMLLVGLSFFGAGNLNGEWGNLTPHFTNWNGFFNVVIMTPFLFLGFDVIPQLAEEIKLPAASIGKLILFSLLLALGWYELVQWTVGLSLSAEIRASSDLATADAMTAAYNSPLAGQLLVSAGLLGIITSWNAFFIGATRLIFAMSRAKMLPSIFCKLHPRYKSPIAAIILMTVPTMLAPFIGRPSLVWLVDAGSAAAVVGYIFVAISFLAIHKKYPLLPRPYQLAAPRLVGILALLSTISFGLLYLPWSPSALVWPYEWAIVLGWSTLGALLVLIRGKQLSKRDKEDQKSYILGNYEHVLLASTPKKN